MAVAGRALLRSSGRAQLVRFVTGQHRLQLPTAVEGSRRSSRADLDGATAKRRTLPAGRMSSDRDDARQFFSLTHRSGHVVSPVRSQASDVHTHTDTTRTLTQQQLHAFRSRLAAGL